MLASHGLLSSRRLEVWRAAGRHGCFAMVPVGLTAYILWFAATHHSFAVDFDHAFWRAGHEVLDGISPYVGTTSPLVRGGAAFVYPAPGALLFAAFSWMPHVAADVLFTAVCIAAALGILWVLGVRDWRLYGVVLLWPPVISGWQTANLSLLIAFGIALAWRLRERPVAAGVLVGLLVSLKVFIWPLGLWLLATRRYAAAGWAVATALLVNALAWALLGFNQLHAYAALVSAVTKVEERIAYTPAALALHLGTSLAVAHALGLVVAGVAAGFCVAYGRRQRETSSLVLALAVSLLAAPIVWLHYFALLIVPLAIARPRLSATWLVPLALFPCPATTPSLWQLLLALSAVAAVFVVLLHRPGLVPERRAVLATGGRQPDEPKITVALQRRGPRRSRPKRLGLLEL